MHASRVHRTRSCSSWSPFDCASSTHRHARQSGPPPILEGFPPMSGGATEIAVVGDHVVSESTLAALRGRLTGVAVEGVATVLDVQLVEGAIVVTSEPVAGPSVAELEGGPTRPSMDQAVAI